MTRLEKFTLGTAIVGLVADICALGILLTQVLSLSQSETLNVSPIVSIITLLVMFYSWLMVSWFIARAYAFQKDKMSESFSTFVKAILGLFVFFVPLYSLWVTIFFPDPTIEFMEEFFLVLLFASVLGPFLALLISIPMGLLLEVVYPSRFTPTQFN
jgi:hypothetical protein